MKSLLALVCAAVLAGCGGKCPPPYYDGAGSDEAWRTMQDGEAHARADDANAVHLFFPTEAVVISATGTPPTFNWTTPLTASRETLPRGDAIASRESSWSSSVGGWIYGSAWAHLPPITGPTHFLRITVPRQTCPLEVLTTRTEWTPNEAAWAALKTFTTGTLTFDVFSAYLQENRITEGPYHFTRPLSFTVAK